MVKRLGTTTALVMGAPLILLVALAVTLAWPDPAPDRVYRIGFEQNPPYHFQHPDGTVSGLTYEAISEAARRKGMRLEWVLRPESSEAALRAGAVDLWPMMADLPHRRRFIYFTAPWRIINYYLLARAGQTATDARYRGTIGVRSLPLHGLLAQQQFPYSKIVRFPEPEDVLAAVCAGQVEAGLFGDAVADRVTRTLRPDCGKNDIRAYPIPGL